MNLEQLERFSQIVFNKIDNYETYESFFNFLHQTIDFEDNLLLDEIIQSTIDNLLSHEFITEEDATKLLNKETVSPLVFEKYRNTLAMKIFSAIFQKSKETQKKQRIKLYIQPIDQVTNKLFAIDYKKNKNNYFEVIIQNKKGIKSAQKITYNLYEMRNGNKMPAQLENKADRVISNVLVSFYHHGIYTMTLEDIYYYASNGAELRTQQQRDEIIQSLLRLSQTFIEIDATNRLKQLKITNMDNKLIGNLVNLTISPNDENINKTKITILNDGIPFYKYAMLDYNNPMLLSRPTKQKRQPTRGLNQVAYVDFFERHINRHKKQPNIFKPVIILKNMFTELQDYEKYINGDMTQRKRMRDTLSKLLKSNEKIKSFEWIKENKKITKIEYKLK